MKNKILYLCLSLLSAQTVFSSQRYLQKRIIPDQEIPKTLRELIEERGDTQIELDILYQPQWYNAYGYLTNLSDSEKIRGQKLLSERKDLDRKISEQQWAEQSLLLRSGYRISQTALLYLATIAALYKTQDYWQVITKHEGKMTFGEVAIAPLMNLLRISLKINEKFLNNLKKNAQKVAQDIAKQA